jgi:hypothetical protein
MDKCMSKAAIPSVIMAQLLPVTIDLKCMFLRSALALVSWNQGMKSSVNVLGQFQYLGVPVAVIILSGISYA